MNNYKTIPIMRKINELPKEQNTSFSDNDLVAYVKNGVTYQISIREIIKSGVNKSDNYKLYSTSHSVCDDCNDIYD